MKYYKIDPTGNITLIVSTPVPRERQRDTAVELLSRDPEAEQVGFLEFPENSDCVLRLQMMGGEFCGNASISCAALIAEKRGIERDSLRLEISGAEAPLSIEVERRGEHSYSGTVAMPLPKSIDAVRLGEYMLPVVSFSGISHIISEGALTREEAEANIRRWCGELKAEALGIMLLQNGQLSPLVYVASTDTAVWENSCASGSTAAAAYLAVREGRSGSCGFAQTGGTLTVGAVLSDGRLTELTLTGSARIMGEYLI